MAFRSIFDKSFEYRNAHSTDIRLTFERIRREQRLKEEQDQAGCADQGAKVVATIGRSRPSVAAK